MGKYSVRGSTAFDAAIDAHMHRIAEALYASRFSSHWKALVLLGGYGRGEGSPKIGPNGREEPFNDYDLIVVTTSLRPALRRELKRLEKELTAELGLPVDLFPYLKRRLPHCEFSLLNFEMKHGHRVIRGDPHILDAMPDYPLARLPLSEGTRLLMNRGKLLLDVKRRLTLADPPTGGERRKLLKFLFKADLAFGDCALLIRRAYDISCTVRKERIGSIDLSGLDEPGDLVAAWLRAVDFKERVDFRPLENANIHLHLAASLRRFERTFLWYERRRLNRTFRTPEKYARRFPDLGNEGQPLKNAVHNLRTFGPQALPHLRTHPRLRLYAALPLLLTRQTHRSETARLLLSSDDRFEPLCDRFTALQQKFS